MRIIIAGGRDYTFTPTDIQRLDDLRGIITEVVCGLAKGADTEGKIWAETWGIPVKEFPADWKRFGRGAGYKRNEEMQKYADGVILFKGGKGTDHMYKTALKGKLFIWDWRVSNKFEDYFD